MLGAEQVQLALGQASSMVLGSGVVVRNRVPPGLHSLWDLGARSQDAVSQKAGDEAWCRSSLLQHTPCKSLGTYWELLHH